MLNLFVFLTHSTPIFKFISNPSANVYGEAGLVSGTKQNENSFKDTLKELGLSVSPYEVIEGMNQS